MYRLAQEEFERLYHAYMESDAWKKFRARYFRSKMPAECIACAGADGMTLHHLTYKRLGKERLTDVAPLCWRCHKQLHKVYRPNDSQSTSPIHRFRHQLRVVFNLTPKQIDERLMPWYRRLTRREEAPKTQHARNYKNRRRERDEAWEDDAG